LNILYSNKLQIPEIKTKPIELIDIDNDIKMNSDSVISKNYINESFENSIKIANPIFSIDLDKLYKEYFTGDFREFNILKLEKMFNDFKILVILINNYKKKAELVLDKERTNKYLNSNNRK
jgi:hypothetical protein